MRRKKRMSSEVKRRWSPPVRPRQRRSFHSRIRLSSGKTNQEWAMANDKAMCLVLDNVASLMYMWTQFLYSDFITFHTCTHTLTQQASPLGHTTSSSSFVHPQLAQLSEHPRQSFIYTPPESGRQPLGVPPAQYSRPRDQERRPGENGGVPRVPGQPSAEGPKMVREGEGERESIHNVIIWTM